MAYAFDSESFGQAVVHIERLVARLANHELALAALSAALEGESDDGVAANGTRANGHARRPSPEPDPLEALLGALHALRAGAREQLRLAEGVRDGLVGTSPSTHNGGPRRPLVLVVDDSKDNREVAALLLETSGFDAITASNGLEGLIVAHYARPSVVLMDVAMPVLDGIQATRLLRASPATQRINVIAHTARADLDGVPMSQLFETVLKKPASPDMMVELVQRYSSHVAS